MLEDMIMLYDLQYNAEKNDDDRSQNYALRMGNNKELTVDQFNTHNHGGGLTPDDDDHVKHMHESNIDSRREIKKSTDMD